MFLKVCKCKICIWLFIACSFVAVVYLYNTSEGLHDGATAVVSSMHNTCGLRL